MVRCALQAGPKREVILYGEALLCNADSQDLPAVALLQSKAVSSWFCKQAGVLAYSQAEQAEPVYEALAASSSRTGELSGSAAATISPTDVH